MRLSSRSSDDADVIRARLRTVLDEARRSPGWVPDGDDLSTPVDRWEGDEEPGDDGAPPPAEPAEGPPLDQGRHRAPAPAVRLDPGRRGVWALCAAGLIAALVLVLWTWLDRPRVTPAPARTAGSASAPVSGMPSPSRSARSPAVGEVAATSATVVVSVVGHVGRPGLVTVSSGARVADAIAAAGGFLPDAEHASVNLAAVVTDGQQIAVGGPGSAALPVDSAAPGSSAAGPVNLNTATVADFDGLPGIGPVLAQRIVDYRSEHGRFASVDQLDDVPGIGPALFARLAGSVTV